MIADREVLREAVLKAIEGEVTSTYQGVPILDPELIADAIVDAVLAAEHTKHEWAYRYPNGHVATWIPQLMTEGIARDMAAEHPDLLTVVRRRVGEWEDA